MTGSYTAYRTLDVTLTDADWSDTITMNHGEGIVAIRVPTDWSTGGIEWAISADGVTFVNVYLTTSPTTFHGNMGAGTIHDNLFSAVGQWDRRLRIRSNVNQSGSKVVTLFIIPFKHYHALGAFFQPRLPMYRIIPDDVNPKRNARDDESLLGGGVA